MTQREVCPEVPHVVDVTNAALAVMRAMDFDQTTCAIGVAHISAVIAGSNQASRTSLALAMLRLARELDPHVPLFTRMRWH
jgi:hypothetical protein